MCHPQAPATKATLAAIEKAREKSACQRDKPVCPATALISLPPRQGGEVALRKMRQERGERLAREFHSQTTAENKRREHEAAEAAAAAIASKAAAEEHEAKVQEELGALRNKVEDLQAEVDKFRAEQELRDQKEAEEAAAKAAAAEAKAGKGKKK